MLPFYASYTTARIFFSILNHFFNKKGNPLRSSSFLFREFTYCSPEGRFGDWWWLIEMMKHNSTYVENSSTIWRPVDSRSHKQGLIEFWQTLKGENNSKRSYLPYRQILGSSGNNLFAGKNAFLGNKAIWSIDFKTIFLDQSFQFHFLTGIQK